jgi:hypothetical protein
VATCASQALAIEGPAACPSDAAMGAGSAVAEATFGPELIRETAPISIFMGEPTGGQTSMLYYFDGGGPIIAPLVFPSEFFGLANSPRSELATVIPAVGGLPGTSNVSITSLRVRIGRSACRCPQSAHCMDLSSPVTSHSKTAATSGLAAPCPALDARPGA